MQGFGQKFVDAAAIANTVGSVTISANPISRYITFSVDKAALGGTPTSGWAFTVTLTGQDGFRPGPGTHLAPRRSAYKFGVCATVSEPPALHGRPVHGAQGDGHDHADRGDPVDELDYTLGPVVLQGVTMP